MCAVTNGAKNRGKEKASERQSPCGSERKDEQEVHYGDGKPEYQYVTNEDIPEDMRTKFGIEKYIKEEPDSQTLLDNMHDSMSEDAKQWFEKQSAAKDKSITPQAHHIVAGKTDSAKLSRKILEEYKININDPRNGVLLPPNIESDAVGSIHRGPQNSEYDNEVHNRLVEALDKSEESSFKEKRDMIFEVLDEIKDDLYNGHIYLNRHTISVKPIEI